MPTYEYACTACDHRLEAVQSFSDEPLATCPECDGDLRKVYGAVGIVLKGAGFYKTDSRGTAGAKGADASGPGESAASSDNNSSATKKEEGSNGSSGSSQEAAPAASTSSA